MALRFMLALDRAFSLSIATEKAIPKMCYELFISAIMFCIPDERVAQKSIDFTVASLHIEFCALCISQIADRNLDVPDPVFRELAAITSGAGQRYAGLVMEFELVKDRSKRSKMENPVFDESYLKEQQSLAEEWMALGFRNIYME